MEKARNSEVIIESKMVLKKSQAELPTIERTSLQV
jgi:hypothetical protein